MSNHQTEHYFETTKEAFQEHEAVEEAKQARKDYIEHLEVDVQADIFKIFALIRESEKKLINK